MDSTPILLLIGLIVIVVVAAVVIPRLAGIRGTKGPDGADTATHIDTAVGRGRTIGGVMTPDRHPDQPSAYERQATADHDYTGSEPTSYETERSQK